MLGAGMLRQPKSLTMAVLTTVVLPSLAPCQSPVIPTERKQVKADAVAAQKTWRRFAAAFATQDGDKVRATVADRPLFLSDTKLRDAVTLPRTAAADWLVIKSGQNYAGGYSLNDPEPFRSMRHDADRANLPFFMLDGFLAGLDLRGRRLGKDLESFRKKSWRRLWVELKRNGLDEKALRDREARYGVEFGKVVLPRKRLRVLLTREGKPRATTIDLTSDAEAGFARGELLFKLHPKAREFYKKEKHAYFVGLMFVSVDAEGIPTYVANTTVK
jgi:hypothetical protein